MINNQTKIHVTNNLNSLAHNLARRMRLAFLIPGMLVLLISACGPVAPSTTQPPNATTAPVGIALPNSPTATQPPANTSVLPSDPRAAVEYALREQPKAMPFQVISTIGSGSNQMVTTVVIETPQRIMMVENTHSVILLDGQCYEKTGDGAWEPCTDPTTGKTAQANAGGLLDESIINDAIGIIQSVKLTGNETLNGINARIYDYSSSGKLMGMQVDSTSTLWVDGKTGLPIKVVTNSTVNSSTSTFTQLITYGPTIKVQAP